MAIPKSFFKPLPAYEWTEEVAEKLAGKIHSAQLTKKERAQEKQRQKKILYQAAKKIITNFPTELGHPRPHLTVR
ncbi:hypothetical protein [Vibrio mytili]|uniref:Uncharacterized protein n=1 Tax=Vibrio mytili TaxID=50718 RepID=A0A0C3I9K8_9VIBR|nr:hypothetical protein [Vibrio mytili]KIN11017.1 hypothetical protein SU60_09620 [Vibrio mytili]